MDNKYTRTARMQSSNPFRTSIGRDSQKFMSPRLAPIVQTSSSLKLDIISLNTLIEVQYNYLLTYKINKQTASPETKQSLEKIESRLNIKEKLKKIDSLCDSTAKIKKIYSSLSEADILLRNTKELFTHQLFVDKICDLCVLLNFRSDPKFTTAFPLSKYTLLEKVAQIIDQSNEDLFFTDSINFKKKNSLGSQKEDKCFGKLYFVETIDEIRKLQFEDAGLKNLISIYETELNKVQKNAERRHKLISEVQENSGDLSKAYLNAVKEIEELKFKLNISEKNLDLAKGLINGPGKKVQAQIDDVIKELNDNKQSRKISSLSTIVGW